MIKKIIKNLFVPEPSMNGVLSSVEPRIHHIIFPSDGKRLSPFELRQNTGIGLMFAATGAVTLYLGATAIAFFVLPSETIMPMGNFILHPFNTFKQMWVSTDIGAVAKVVAYIKAFAVTGITAYLTKFIYSSVVRIDDGYVHVEGKKFFKHTLYSKEIMKTELQSINALRGIKNEACVQLLGDLPLNFQLLVSNAVVGKPGSGKTVFYKNLISKILQDPESVLIVHDFKGDFTNILNPDESIILAPWDKRCRELALAIDLETEQDAIEFWNAIIPEPKGDAFWANSARAIGVGLTKKLMKEKPQAWTIPDLTDSLVESIQNIKKAMDVYNKPAARSVSEDEDNKMTQSILATLISETLPLFNLASAYRGRRKRQFSVKEWVQEVINGTLKESQEYKNKRIIILQFNATYPKLSQAYIKTVLNSLASQLNNPAIPDNPKRKIYILLDELPQLGKIDNLEMFLEVGRSKGLKLFFAWQTMEQMPKIYGKEAAENIYSNIANYWFMQMSTKSMKDWAESKCGKRTVKHWKSNDSFNAQGQSYSSNLQQEDIEVVKAHTFESEIGVKSSGVLGIVNIADLKGVYKLAFPFVQDYQWHNNKSVVLADWIKNWADEIKDVEQVEAVSADEKIKNDPKVKELMGIYDDSFNMSKNKKSLPKQIEIVDDSKNVDVVIKDNGISSKQAAIQEAPMSPLEEQQRELQLLEQNFPLAEQEEQEKPVEKKYEPEQIKAVPGEVQDETLNVVAEPLGHHNPLVMADLLLSMADAVSKVQLNSMSVDVPEKDKEKEKKKFEQ